MNAALTHKKNSEAASGSTAKPFFSKSAEQTFFPDKQQNTSFFPAIQAKLSISTPHDPEEKEADAAADLVMRAPEPPVAPVTDTEEALQRVEEEEETETIQTKSTYPGITTLQCKEEDVPLQAKLFADNHHNSNNHNQGTINDGVGKGDCCSWPIQRSSRGPPYSTTSFEHSLSSSKGVGNALPSGTKQFMESRFNADFSGVRIHTGSHAENLSRQINAQAFTHGNDIYFNTGKFSPDTAGGGKLLAHELTHTIQQGASKSNTVADTQPAISSKKIQTNLAAPDARAGNRAFAHPKPELSNWSVDTSGELITDSDYAEDSLQDFSSMQSVYRKPGSAEQCKCESENKEEKNLARKEQSSATSAYTNSQRSQSANDSSTILTSERDRGPPAIALHREDIIQRSVIDTALGYVGSITDCAAWDFDEAKACILNKAQQVALHIPGYRALRVVLSQDPITGEHIDRSGRNFIEAAFDIMPGGELLYRKLDEQHQLDAAAAWIDTQIASVTGLVEGLISEVQNFWNRLGISDVTDPIQVLRDGVTIVLGFINRVIDFAVNAAKELLEMVKQFLLTKIVDFVKEQTTAYPLLTVILGKDPITDQEVEPNGTNILNALLELGGEVGIQQRDQMQDTGTFQKVAGYIDEGIVVFSGAYDQIVQGFRNIWDWVTIENLMDPTATFQSIYNEFAEPVQRVWNFVEEVGRAILTFIKEVLMQRLSAWAKTVRGYPLITVILGKDPFTDEEVPRSMHNIIRGFFSLMEGGEDQYNQLKESGAIDRTVKKVEAAVDSLNMTPAYIVQLFIDLWNSFSLSDLANPPEAFQRIIDRFGEPIGRLISFVAEIVKIVIEAVLIVMKFPIDIVNNIIAKAMQAIEMIKKDPVGFLKNLLRAIKQGFTQFFDNILQHLLKGLVGWLTSELREAGVPEITDTSLRGIISWVLEVLGISMEKIWEKLAAHPRIGPQRVAQIRGMINKLEGIWTFIKDVQERGMAAIWDKIAEQLSNLWDTILDAIKNWIMEQIINKMVTKLLSMLDPTGIMAVVNSVIALYNAIESFVKYLREMLEIVNSFVEGVVEIASGNIVSAANFLERSLARAVPVVIGFLANQVGLGGIGKRIGELIGSAREMVDKALTWLVNKAVDTGLGLLDKVVSIGKAAVGAILKWLGLEKKFDANDGKQHKLYFGGSEESPVLMIQSSSQAFTAFIESVEVGTDEKKIAAKAQAKTIAGQVDTKKREPLQGETEEQKKESKRAKIAAVEALLSQLAVPAAELFGDASAAGEPEVNFTAQVAGHAQGMTAKKLNNKQTLKGSAPTASATASYAVLNTRRQREGVSYYVKGHMLNENIGGKGVWQNLTPLSREGNSNHEGLVESLVKAAFNSGAVIEYDVTAAYGYGNNAASIPADDPQKDQKLKIITEEKNVPTHLECEAWILEKKGEVFDRKQNIVTKTVNNPVEQDAASYILEGESGRAEIYLNSSDISVIATIEGFSASLAEKVERAHQESGKTRFSSYADLSNATTKADGKPIFEDAEKANVMALSKLKYVKLYKG